MEGVASAKKPRVFISYSRSDKDFVARLAADIDALGLDIWVDNMAISVGESIVERVSQALSDSDYLLAVVSEHSMKSKWVRAELAAGLARELSSKGVVVLPLRLDNAEVPALIEDRLYADFRDSYEVGIKAVVEVLSQEAPSALKGALPAVSCLEILAAKSDGDLRRLLHRRLGRVELRAVWHAVFETDMEDDMANRDKLSCVLELLIRARKRRMWSAVHKELCADFPFLGEED